MNLFEGLSYRAMDIDHDLPKLASPLTALQQAGLKLELQPGLPCGGWAAGNQGQLCCFPRCVNRELCVKPSIWDNPIKDASISGFAYLATIPEFKFEPF